MKKTIYICCSFLIIIIFLFVAYLNSNIFYQKIFVQKYGYALPEDIIFEDSYYDAIPDDSLFVSFKISEAHHKEFIDYFINIFDEVSDTATEEFINKTCEEENISLSENTQFYYRFACGAFFKKTKIQILLIDETDGEYHIRIYG